MDKKTRMISIVMPVHNAESTIEDCLDSLLKQNYPHFEVLCVDDASEDHGLEILSAYEKKDKRIRVLKHFVGRGPFASRSTGLQYAKGSHVWFVDDDAFVETHTLHCLVEELEKKDWPILAFGMWQWDGKKRTPLTFNKKQILSMEEALKHYLDPSTGLDVFPHMGNKLYKIGLFRNNGLIFPEGRFYEDVAINIQILKQVDEVLLLPERYYYQRLGENAHQFPPKTLKDLDKFFFMVEKIMTELPTLSSYPSIQTHLVKGISALLQEVGLSAPDESASKLNHFLTRHPSLEAAISLQLEDDLSRQRRYSSIWRALAKHAVVEKNLDKRWFYWVRHIRYLIERDGASRIARQLIYKIKQLGFRLFSR